MKKTILTIVGSLVILLAIIYIIYKDSLPPRTGHKVARLISGLSIPADAKIVDFKDQWNEFNGNGFSFVVLSLDEESFNKIYQEAKSSHYKPLPITEEIYGPLKEISENKKKGIYKVQMHNKESMSFQAAVLTDDDNHLMVYFAVN